MPYIIVWGLKSSSAIHLWRLLKYCAFDEENVLGQQSVFYIKFPKLQQLPVRRNDWSMRS